MSVVREERQAPDVESAMVQINDALRSVFGYAHTVANGQIVTVSVTRGEGEKARRIVTNLDVNTCTVDVAERSIDWWREQMRIGAVNGNLEPTDSPPEQL